MNPGGFFFRRFCRNEFFPGIPDPFYQTSYDCGCTLMTERWNLACGHSSHELRSVNVSDGYSSFLCSVDRTLLKLTIWGKNRHETQTCMSPIFAKPGTYEWVMNLVSFNRTVCLYRPLIGSIFSSFLRSYLSVLRNTCLTNRTPSCSTSSLAGGLQQFCLPSHWGRKWIWFVFPIYID